MKKSASWVKLGEPMYCTTIENHSRASSKHSKIHKSFKSKNQSTQGSDKKSKRSKPKKILTNTHKNHPSLKRGKKGWASVTEGKIPKKVGYVTDKKKGANLSTSSKLHSNSCINLLITQDYARNPKLGRQPTLDISSMKQNNFKNISPSRISDFYEPLDEPSVLIPYHELPLQNTYDLRKLQELRKNAKSCSNLLPLSSDCSYSNYNPATQGDVTGK